MEKKKFTFYRVMSILFFVTGLIFGTIAFVSGSETGVIGEADEDGYVQTMTEQVDYKLFISAVAIPWFMCAFFGYCDTKEDGANAMKELKGLITESIKK